MIFYSDDPVRDAERHQAHNEPKVIGKCEQCGDDICADEDYYDIYGALVHEDCLKDWAKRFLVRSF